MVAQNCVHLLDGLDLALDELLTLVSLDAAEGVEEVASGVAVQIVAETLHVSPPTIDEGHHGPTRHGVETLGMRSQTVQTLVVPRTSSLHLVDARRIVAAAERVRVGGQSAALVDHVAHIAAVDRVSLSSLAELARRRCGGDGELERGSEGVRYGKVLLG